MACKVGLIVYCILQAIAFLFILVGAPIDQFRYRSDANDDSSAVENTFSNKQCLTFWGYKPECYSTKYDYRPTTFFEECSGRKTRFQAAEAFAIISIAVTLVAMIFGFIQLCCCRCFRWLCLVLNILSVGTVCVCWACMVSEYYSSRNKDLSGIGIIAGQSAFVRCGKLEETTRYGAGFGLYVVGWCLCVLNIIFIMLPC